MEIIALAKAHSLPLTTPLDRIFADDMWPIMGSGPGPCPAETASHPGPRMRTD